MRKIFSLRFLFASLLALATLVTFASAQSAYVIAYYETTAPLPPLVKAIYAEIGIHPIFELVPSERAGPVLARSMSYHVLNKRHAGLIPKFDAVLKEMKSDGLLSKYLDQK